MNKHTTARIGKRVHIILKSGEQFIDKLVEIKAAYYVLKDRGRVFKNIIRSFSIARMEASKK